MLSPVTILCVTIRPSSNVCYMICDLFPLQMTIKLQTLYTANGYTPAEGAATGNSRGELLSMLAEVAVSPFRYAKRSFLSGRRTTGTLPPCLKTTTILMSIYLGHIWYLFITLVPTKFSEWSTTETALTVHNVKRIC